jgi:uncharacterized protein (TIGR02001 family)
MGAACRRLLLMASLAAGAANAGNALDEFGGSLGLTSDDIYHGISLTCGNPAAQGELHYRSSGGQASAEAFAGVWASAGLGRAACGKAREINFYTGYGIATGTDSSASLSYTHYAYPGGSYTLGPVGGYRYDYDALEAEWAWQDQLYLTLAWTPDALRFADYTPLRDRSALTYGLQLHHPLSDGLSLSAGAGYDEIADPSGAGYGFWDAGVGYTLGPVQLQLDYVGTAGRAIRVFGSNVAGSRASLSALWRF